LFLLFKVENKDIKFRSGKKLMILKTKIFTEDKNKKTKNLKDDKKDMNIKTKI